MAKPPKKKPREDEVQAAVRVVNTVIAKHEGAGATLVPAPTDDDPTQRRIEKKPKK